jgi:sulfide:quinone oxidoreductase
MHGQPATSSFDGRGYCFVEVGGGKALKAEGEFLAEPHPLAHFADRPSEDGFREKLAFESDRLRAWFGG